MEDTKNQELFILLDAFLSNKESILKKFYIAEYPKTKYYILKNGGNIEQVKDIYQEAYFACWKKINSGTFTPKNEAEIEAYLFTIAKNRWIDQTRMAAKRRTISLDDHMYQLPADDGTQIDDLEKTDRQLSITLAAFEELGQACKDLLTQFYFYKMSLRDIAEGLEIGEASAKNKKYRCVKKLIELTQNKTTGE